MINEIIKILKIEGLVLLLNNSVFENDFKYWIYNNGSRMSIINY